jgi:3-oxoacyl-[acyl-carrier-protein] synthase III
MPELVREPVETPPHRPVASGAAIASVAMAVPETAVPTRVIADRLGVGDGWIETRTGIRSRRIAASDERLYALAARAGSDALRATAFDPAELDLVLVATMSHDHLTPSAAALVAAEIGAGRAGALDLNAACSGFVAALGAAAAQIECGRAGAVLVIGADLLSRHTDPYDRGTAGLFGDGAGAVAMRAVDPPGRIGPVVLGADGANADLVYANRDEGLIRMNGADTFRHAVDRLSEATLEALDADGQGIDAIDLFVYHQANSRIIGAVGERLRLPSERVIDCMSDYGNTSAASVPIALAEAQRRSLLFDGAKVLLAAFGGGLTWAATVVDWGLADAA